MEYNIDILVAGCNTTCLHCYVNGGIGPSMSYNDFKICMEKLSPVFTKLNKHVSFTLDNEVFNHENALEILELVEDKYKDYYFHHGSTTGIAFLKHPKQKQLIHLLKRNNWDFVSFAIHANHEKHNEIVHCKDALQKIIDASKICKDNNFKVLLSIMISKTLLADLDGINEVLDTISYDRILAVIPDYYPTTRLNKYQAIRCNKDEYNDIIHFFKQRNVKVEDIEKCVHICNEENVLKNINLHEIKNTLTSENTVVLHIDHKLNFYCGNTGSSIQFLGNIKEMSSDDIYDKLLHCKDNYYETSNIHYEDILDAIKNNTFKKSKENYVYPNAIAALIAMLHNYKK